MTNVNVNDSKMIKMGIKLNLEMKPVIVSSNVVHKRILKLNFFEVDTIKSLKYINSVIAYDKDIKYIYLIIKFCNVTKLPLKLYIKNELSEKIIQKLQKYKITYKIITPFN